MDITKEIIEYVRKNRVSTTEIADCLGKSGAIKGITPVNRGHFKVGMIKWIFALNESNWTIHQQIEKIEEDKIIFASQFNCKERALFGELVSKYLLLYKQSLAIVVDGFIRDAGALIKENYPIWSKGFNPEGCFNTRPNGEVKESILQDYRRKYEGAVAVCDDCGVVVIPKEKLNREMLDKIKGIELQEDIWFERLDKFKESTFDIVCRKKYLEN